MKELSSLIDAMILPPADKLAIFLILAKVSDANRIDIHEGMESPDLIKIALFKMGLFSVSVPTSGRTHHLCGLAVARSKQVAEDFAKAIAENNEVKIRKLVGCQVTLPIAKTNLHVIKLLEDYLPELLEELTQKKMVAA